MRRDNLSSVGNVTSSHGLSATVILDNDVPARSRRLVAILKALENTIVQIFF
jgi:hypothetical protein